LQYRARRIFAMKSQPPKDQPFLVVLKSPDQPESARVHGRSEPDHPKGTNGPGFLRAVARWQSGGGVRYRRRHEEGRYVFEVETGKKLATWYAARVMVIPAAAASLERRRHGIYYTRSPRGAEKPKEEMNLYQAGLLPQTDADGKRHFEIGKDFPKIERDVLETAPGRQAHLASMKNGDGGEFAHYLLGPNG